MTTSASYKEEECCSIYWKIKNFSYYFDAYISSPVFNFSNYQYGLYLTTENEYIMCELFRSGSCSPFSEMSQLSFLTCDGSPEESISGNECIKLKVPKDVVFRNRRNAFLPDDTFTVRFRYPSNERGNIFISSEIGVKFKYFMWTLKDINKNESTFAKTLEKDDSYGDIKLNLKQNVGYKTDKQLYFEVTRNRGEKCFYTLKMSVLDSEGNALKEICDEHVFEKKNGLQVRVFPLFFKRKELLACEKLDLFGDTLSLKCNFAISFGTIGDQIVYSNCVTPSFNELKSDLTATFKEKTDSLIGTSLQSDLKSILDSGTLGDVSLKIDTEVIQVHRVILSARSPVFKAMFTKDMQEAINNTVVIEDLDLETVRGLILYMYTDSISDCHCENIRKLYFAADKYEVLTLKNECISWLKTNLSISNVCEVLILAGLHQDETLKRATYEFILKFDTQIFTLDTWKELKESHPKLALEVMCEIYSKKT